MFDDVLKAMCSKYPTIDEKIIYSIMNAGYEMGFCDGFDEGYAEED